MMSYEMVQEAVRALGYDASMVVDDAERCLDVTLHDDDYDDAGAVDRFVEMLEDECLRECGDCYEYYYFSDFMVRVGYDSLDD